MIGGYAPEEMPSASRHMTWSEPYCILYELPEDKNLRWVDNKINWSVVHGATLYEMAAIETDIYFFDHYFDRSSWIRWARQ